MIRLGAGLQGPHRAEIGEAPEAQGHIFGHKHLQAGVQVHHPIHVGLHLDLLRGQLADPVVPPGLGGPLTLQPGVLQAADVAGVEGDQPPAHPAQGHPDVAHQRLPQLIVIRHQPTVDVLIRR